MTEEETRIVRFYFEKTGQSIPEDLEQVEDLILNLAYAFRNGYKLGWAGHRQQLNDALNAKDDAPGPGWSVVI